MIDEEKCIAFFARSFGGNRNVSNQNPLFFWRQLAVATRRHLRHFSPSLADMIKRINSADFPIRFSQKPNGVRRENIEIIEIKNKVFWAKREKPRLCACSFLGGLIGKVAKPLLGDKTSDYQGLRGMPNFFSFFSCLLVI